MAAAAVLDFQKFKFLTADTLQRPNMRNPAKFHQDRPIRKNMAIFRFSRWRPSALLDLNEKCILRFGTVGTAHMPHCAKFGRNRSNTCKDIAI